MTAAHISPADRMRAWAHSLISYGWRVEPCRIVQIMDSAGELKKQPQGLRTQWQRQGYTDPASFDARAAEIGASGYLVVCGPSNLVVADADGAAGMATLAAMRLPPTLTVDTPSGGVHAYYAADPDRPVSNSQVAGPGLDIRGQGGGAFGPGSFLIGLQGGIVGTWAARAPLVSPVRVPATLLAYSAPLREHAAGDIPGARLPSPADHLAAAASAAGHYFAIMCAEAKHPSGRWNQALYHFVRWAGRMVATQGYASVDEATNRALEYVYDAIRHGPGMYEPDEKDRTTIRPSSVHVGLRQGPWTPSDPIESIEGWGSPPVPGQAAERATTAAQPSASGPLPKPGTRRMRVVSAANTAPKVAHWLWRDEHGGRLPAGELSVVAGRGGVGKSPFTLWLAARLSRGDLPGDHFGICGNTLIYATEDDWAATIVPRLIAAGADLTRVLWIEAVDDDQLGETAFSWTTDIPLLVEGIEAASASLLIIDPLINVMERGDAHHNADVNRALRRLVTVAHEQSCSIVGLLHASKATDGQLDNIINGSVAWRNVPRAALLFAKHPETGEGIISQNKNNLGRTDLPNLAFSMTGVDVSINGGLVNHPVFVPGDVTETELADALNAATVKANGPQPIEALSWLADMLADGPVLQGDIRTRLDDARDRAEPLDERSWETIRKQVASQAGRKLFRVERERKYQGSYFYELTAAGRDAYRVTVAGTPLPPIPTTYGHLGSDQEKPGYQPVTNQRTPSVPGWGDT